MSRIMSGDQYANLRDWIRINKAKIASKNNKAAATIAAVEMDSLVTVYGMERARRAESCMYRPNNGTKHVRKDGLSIKFSDEEVCALENILRKIKGQSTVKTQSGLFI